MHILFLTDNFPPEGNAPATRTFEHTREWVKQGHEVTVITCAPNFPEGVLFPGYKNKWYQRELMDGIEVVRVKTYITANEGFAKRILDYISFGFMGGFVGLFQKRPDVIVSTSPQFFSACGAWVLSVFGGNPGYSSCAISGPPRLPPSVRWRKARSSSCWKSWSCFSTAGPIASSR